MGGEYRDITSSKKSVTGREGTTRLGLSRGCKKVRPSSGAFILYGIMAWCSFFHNAGGGDRTVAKK